MAPSNRDSALITCLSPTHVQCRPTGQVRTVADRAVLEQVAPSPEFIPVTYPVQGLAPAVQLTLGAPQQSGHLIVEVMSLPNRAGQTETGCSIDRPGI